MRAPRSTGLALAACLVIAGWSRCAQAAHAPTGFGLEYHAAPELGCPSGEALRTALRERLEYDAFSPVGPADYTVRVEVERAGSGLQARIDWVDRSGLSEGGRRLVSENADCAELARGIVFAVAVQVQLRASNGERQGATESSPVKAPAVAPPPVAYPKPTEARRVAVPAPTPWLVLLGLGGGVEHGWSPGPSPKLDIVAALSWGRLWLEVGGGGSTPTRQTASDGTGFEVRNFRAWLSPCFRTPPWSWCGAGTVGSLHVRGFGVDYPSNPRATMGAAGGRVELLLPALRNFAVLAHVEALGTFTRQTVTLNEATRWSTSPLYLGVGIDVALIFR